MEQSRQNLIQLTDRMIAMLPDVQLLMKRNHPNVTGVEVGLKRREGALTDTVCFRVIVNKKLEQNQLAPGDLIPKEIKGIPTDVLTEHNGFKTEDTGGYDLMTGGIRIDSGFGGGTLGCFVTRNAEPAATRKIYLLTNHHVIVGDTGAVGTRVGQPTSPSSCKCCMSNDIAEVFCGERGTPGGTATTVGTTLTPAGSPNSIDAAIAKLLGQDTTDPKTVYFANSIEEIGPVFGSSPSIQPGDRVRKRGQKTGLSFGRVEAIQGVTFNEHDKKDPTKTITYSANVILIAPLAETPIMSDEGDSGSVIVNARNQVVALLFAAGGNMVDGDFKPNGQGLAFAIDAVTTRLGISVLSSGTAASIPLSGISESAIKPVRAVKFLSDFEKHLRAIPQGQQFMQILLDHRNEVMDLINDNREVKLAWHRTNGPEYIGHIIKNYTDVKHPLPSEINGYSLQNLVIKMADVLERNGSNRLAKAVDDYSAFAFNFANQYNGVDSLEDVLTTFKPAANQYKPPHSKTHAD